VFAADDATIAHFEHNGIYRGNQENNLLDGFSIQCAGVNVIINKKSSVRGGCRLPGPKGDTIGLTFEGTGRAKGRGTAVAFQACLRYHGAFTVPN